MLQDHHSFGARQLCAVHGQEPHDDVTKTRALDAGHFSGPVTARQATERHLAIWTIDTSRGAVDRSQRVPLASPLPNLLMTSYAEADAPAARGNFVTFHLKGYRAKVGRHRIPEGRGPQG